MRTYLRAGGPVLPALALALAITGVDLAAQSAIGIGFLVLVPLVAAARGGSPALTGAIAAVCVAVAVLLGVPTGYFGRLEHVGPVLTVALGGVLAIYLAFLREARARDAERLGIQYRVARTLQESRHLEEAAPRLLEAIGSPLGWEIGGLWEVRQPRVLRSVETWYAPGIDPSVFGKLSRQFVLRPGVGLPGRVWETGDPVWVFDVTDEKGLPRAELAARVGLRGAVGFPLLTSTGVVGVMEFFAREVREPDTELLDLLGALGGQIGEFLEVLNAEEALRESEARKGAMLQSALDCVVTMDHEGNVVEFNPAAERTFGYAEEDVLGRQLAELIIPPEYRDLHREALVRYAETGESQILGSRIEVVGMRSDGSEFPVELAVNQIGGQEPPLFTGYIRDITERRRAESERERLLELERLARMDADRARDQLAAILRGVADAVTAQAPDGSLIFANQRAVEALGFDSTDELLKVPADRLRARFELFDESGEPLEAGRLPEARALRGEDAPDAVVREVDRETHAERWLVLKSTPIRGEQGAVVMAINVSEDITELKRAESSQRMLAEAGRVLASSLDTDTMLNRLTDLLVPELGDVASAHLRASDGRVALAALQAVDDGANERFRAILSDGRLALDAVVESGEGRIVAPAPEPGRTARDGCAAVIAPVTSRGVPAGAIALARFGGGRRYDREHLAVAEELGRRLGVAIDTARLYEERAYVAKTLQESLLPSQLPEIPGLETAARFRATGDGNDVGGDFYDLFEVEGGRWSVVVGDVCGKGPDAAAVTALARYTLRAAAMREPGPSEGLRMLNEALLRQRGDMRFATVAYATLVPPDGAGTLEATVASAGHPLPLILRADGGVEAVGVYGTLAGVVPDPDLEDASADLEPGDALVFYTDGVTEARDDGGIFGDERLRDLLASCAGMDADAIAARVETAAVEMQDGETRDDIAVVVLRAPANATSRPAAAEPAVNGDVARLHVNLGGGAQAAGRARQALARVGSDLGEPLLENMRLLVTELVTNSIRHAGAEDIELTVRVGADVARVEVANPGEPFSPRPRTPDADQESGWGLFLVDHLTDSWGVEETDGGTRVWFEIARA